MLIPTSHFLGQVWEFPICASAPAQHNQDNRDFGSLVFLLFTLSIMLMIPLSHSHELLGINSASALPRVRQKRHSGSSRKCLCAALWCCSGRRQSERIPAASSCRTPALLAGGLGWKMAPNHSLELGAFSPGWQLGSL